MKRFTRLGIIAGLLTLLIVTCSPSSLAQTQYLQSYGPVSSLVACTAATGVATSAVNTPCGGQGAMFQNTNVVLHTLTWTSVAGTGAVSTCTVQLETSAAGQTFVAMSGAVAQTCTSSGSYSFLAAAGANFVKFNVTALTTTGTASVTFNYTATAQTAVSVPAATYVQFCGATNGATVNCANTTGLGGPARVIGGLATLASSASVITFAPGFTSTSTYACAGVNQTTAANVLKIANTSATSITITENTGTVDVISYVCVGY